MGKDHLVYQLYWDDTVEQTASDGNRYLDHSGRQTKMRTGAVPGTKKIRFEMWENPDQPDRYPVDVYYEYKLRCPAEMMSPDKPYYL
jgi:hypothetical protein